MDVLTDEFIFKCDCGTPAIFRASDTKSKATSTGAKLLTTNATVKGSGTCSKLNSGTCAFVKCGSWVNTSGKFTINGLNTLTEKSFLMCKIGGKIKSFTGFSKAVISRGISVPTMPSVTTPAVILNDEKVGENQAVLSENNDKTNANTENKSIESDLVSKDDSNSSIKEQKVNDYIENVPDFPYALCDYKNCPEWQDCKYLKSQYDPNSIDNDSEKLEKRYKSSYPAQYNEYCLLEESCNQESTEGSWKHAAHHIISGNQIFAKHPYLVKLANFYGYDVNNADNCIILPSTHSFKGKTGVDKQANGYVAMSYMRQQWHIGGHSYTMDSQTVENIHAYLEKTSYINSELYKNYVEAVEHEMCVLESKYKKISCRKKEYEIKQKRFISAMNKVSQKVAQKLLEFRADPKHSFPFYVSNEAVHYAFDIPKKKKFIIIYPKYNRILKKNETVAVLMTVTRYQKEQYMINFTQDNEHIITDSYSFIRFAKNTKYFISLVSDFHLPWVFDQSREYFLSDSTNIQDIDTYCKSNEQKIISFIEGRENGEMYYEPDSKIIKQRLGCMVNE